MAITKANILTHLNLALRKNETDIDEYILEAMKDLSLQDDFLFYESTVDTIIGRTYYSLPVNYKGMMTIKIDDNTPLTKISFRDYQKLIADQTSSDRDEPVNFAIHGGFWYAYPTPDAVYTAKLFFAAYVPESEGGTNAVDSIDTYFSDIYRKALYTKTKALYCGARQDMKKEAAGYESEYRLIDLPPLRKLIEREPRVVTYCDY